MRQSTLVETRDHVARSSSSGLRSTKRTIPNDELVIDSPTEGSKQKRYVAAHTAETTSSPCVVNYDTVLSQLQALRQSDKHDYSSSALICSQDMGRARGGRAL